MFPYWTILTSLLLVAPLVPARALSPADLYAQCAKAIAQLQGEGIIRGLKVHGTAPRGFDLLVNQGKWQLIDPTTQGTIVHLAACYVAQGNSAIQISGIVHDAQSNKELGAMGLSGEYFPHAQGPGLTP